MVERNLAKVEVESSRLFSRSRYPGKTVECEPAVFPLFVENCLNHDKNKPLLRLSCFWKYSIVPAAGWQSGHAAACKAVYAGSIPTPASSLKHEQRGPVPMLRGTEQGGHASLYIPHSRGNTQRPFVKALLVQCFPIILMHGASGGIGIHKGLKIPRRKPCRFKSGLAHHSVRCSRNHDRI